MSEDEEFLRECRWYRNCSCISHDNPFYQKESVFRLACPIDNIVHRIDYCRYYKPQIVIEPDILHEIISIVDSVQNIPYRAAKSPSYLTGYNEACMNMKNNLISQFSGSSQGDKDVTG